MSNKNTGAPRTVTLQGGPAIAVDLGRPQAAPAPSSAADAKVNAAAAAQAAAPLKASSASGAQPAGFFCSLCKMGFHDTLALSLHKRSKKHREAAGLLDPEAEQERSRLPSVEELRTFIAAKAREQRLKAAASNRRPTATVQPGAGPLKAHRAEGTV
jgi:hypothetical protein